MSDLDFTARVGELARDLRGAPDPAETLQQIVDATVQLFPACTGAGITLVAKDREIRTAAASSQLHEKLDRIEYELGEGPCLDAIWKHRIVRVTDLVQDERWPQWGPRAVDEFDIRSMVCVQLYTPNANLGSLSVSSTTADSFDEDDVEQVLALGAHAAAAIAASEDRANLHTALQSRTVIGQATGLLMAKYAISSGNAFNLLLRLSSERNRKVVVLARELVDDWESTEKGNP